MKRYIYQDDFKERAVILFRQVGIAKASKVTHVTRATLYRWNKEFGDDLQLPEGKDQWPELVLFIYFDIYPLPDTLLLFLMSHPSSHPLHPNLRRTHRREASANRRMAGSRYHADHVGNRTPA